MAKKYRIKERYARKTGLARLLLAEEVARAPGRVRLRGRSDIDLQMGICSICGHPTTTRAHLPCGRELVDDFQLGSAVKREQLRRELELMTFDEWFPIDQIESVMPTKMSLKSLVDVTPKATMTAEVYTQSILLLKFIPDPLLEKELRKQFHCARIKSGLKVPFNENVVRFLEARGFQLPEEALKLKNKRVTTADVHRRVSHILQKGIELYPYQLEGVAFMETKGGRLLLADEQGLGKTPQAIGYTMLHPELWPVLVVVPSVVKWNWADEFRKFIKKPPNIQILSGRKVYPIDPKTDVVIINPDILADWEVTLQKWKPGIAVVDEAHGFKSGKTYKTKALKSILKRCYGRVIMTGTPVLNNPMEAFSMVEFASPGLLGSFSQFRSKYMGNGPYPAKTLSKKKAKMLNDEMKQCMIRRLKKDVLKDLPAKQRSTVSLHVKDTSLIEKARNEALAWIRKNKDNPAGRMILMGKLIQACSKTKLKLAIEWIDSLLESTNKVVVMCVYKATIQALMERYGNRAVKIDGSVTGEKRNDAVKAFQNNPKIEVIICQAEAAGVGITLTAASNTVFVEYLFSAGKMVQAEDRIHRVGQTEMVNIWYLVVANSIEQRIISILNRKMAMINAIIDDNQNDTELISDEITEILKDWEH